MWQNDCKKKIIGKDARRNGSGLFYSYYPDISVKGLRQTIKNLNKVIRARDLPDTREH
jgi:hypothetical protein